MDAQQLVSALGGSNGKAHCPAHHDRHASLSVSDGNGKVLFKCHAGCSQQRIINALKLFGLWGRRTFGGGNSGGDHRKKDGGGEKLGRIVDSYPYFDAERLRYEVVRFEPKTFRQRRPDGHGGDIWNMQGVAPLPYRLRELLKAKPSSFVFVVEGEKDVDALLDLDLVATCNHGGAGKWRPEISRYLQDRKVVLLPDNDETGRAHMADVAAKLSGVAEWIKVVELPDLPEKGDVSDWIGAGGAGAADRAGEGHPRAQRLPCTCRALWRRGGERGGK